MKYGIKHPSPNQTRSAFAAVARIKALQERFKTLDNATVSAEIAPGVFLDEVKLDRSPSKGCIEIEQPVTIDGKVCTGGMFYEPNGEVKSTQIQFVEDGLEYEYGFSGTGRKHSYHERVSEPNGRAFSGNSKCLVARNIHIDPATGLIRELATTDI